MSLMSVAQLPSVESAAEALSSLRERFDDDSVYTLSAPYHVANLSLDGSGNNLIVVELPRTGISRQQILSDIGKPTLGVSVNR